MAPMTKLHRIKMDYFKSLIKRYFVNFCPGSFIYRDIVVSSIFYCGYTVPSDGESMERVEETAPSFWRHTKNGILVFSQNENKKKQHQKRLVSPNINENIDELQPGRV